MMKPETTFKVKVMKDLAELGRTIPIYFEKIQSVAVRGIPDLIACIGGHFVAMELKRSSAKPRKDEVLQNYKLDKIKKAGGLSFVVTPELWPTILEELKNIAKKELK
jgi:hypothetical protein